MTYELIWKLLLLLLLLLFSSSSFLSFFLSSPFCWVRSEEITMKAWISWRNVKSTPGMALVVSGLGQISILLCIWLSTWSRKSRGVNLWVEGNKSCTWYPRSRKQTQKWSSSNPERNCNLPKIVTRVWVLAFRPMHNSMEGRQCVQIQAGLILQANIS